MKPPAKTAANGSVIALALTWDGARWPVRTLPPKARAFLKVKGPSGKIPSARSMAKLFAAGRVCEIRLCWVPRLKGGTAVLSEPFQTPAKKRIGFQSVKTARFGDILGVIYRRQR
ncbi:MAG TPA: hypothetical protein VGZ93_08430 [Candidatus Methylacidiphilales bacterium]|jgi:hypothetical protein|nr:hypothetical protein [Candidatus Methylacidiphilales bacterium]